MQVQADPGTGVWNATLPGGLTAWDVTPHGERIALARQHERDEPAVLPAALPHISAPRPAQRALVAHRPRPGKQSPFSLAEGALPVLGPPCPITALAAGRWAAGHRPRMSIAPFLVPDSTELG